MHEGRAFEQRGVEESQRSSVAPHRGSVWQGDVGGGAGRGTEGNGAIGQPEVRPPLLVLDRVAPDKVAHEVLPEPEPRPQEAGLGQFDWR